MSNTLSISTQNNARTFIRKVIRAKRKSLSQSFQKKASNDLLSTLTNNVVVKNAQHIALYLANDGEVDLQPFIRWCWQQKKQVYLPVIHPFCSGHLLFLLYEENSIMIKNHYGIFEPKLSINKVCPLPQLDLLFTPLVAFDSKGARLGMGGGFYDRTLANWQQHQVYPIGLAHDCQQVAEVPVENWDIPLPKIITPTRTFNFKT
jgi:5-formyltetrahydrofolate cyclo-ligase